MNSRLVKAVKIFKKLMEIKLANTKKYLVLLDADKIKEYIFATNKLKEIRGASAILDKLCYEKVVEKRVKNYSGDLIYSAGGTVKAVFNDPDKAKNFILNEKELFYKTTQTATITGISLEVSENDYENKFPIVNTKAERELRKQKDAKLQCVQILSHPFIRICDSCRIYPAIHRYYKDENPLLCQSCYKKRLNEKRTRLFTQFKVWLRKELSNGSTIDGWDISSLKKYCIPDDLDGIGKESKNYIGLIYCDGNRMGQKLEEIGTNPEKFKEFSNLIKESIQKALFNAVAKNIQPNNKNIVPVEFIILGGDDLVCVVPANKTILIAKQICKEFHELTINNEFNNKEYETSISAGVAIAHSKFPLYRLFEVAEDLLKSAKCLSNAYFALSTPRNTSCLDFTVISTTSTNSLEMVREKEFTCSDKNYLLYRRPYKVYENGTASNSDELELLINATQVLKSNSFPKTKLNQFYNALQSKNHDLITYESLLVNSRLSKENLNLLAKNLMIPFELDPFPWQSAEIENVYKTPITDLIELYDFID
ncbi:MAG: type III-B CRISPR-associated protein Cas10/Cmr2 [Actinobacteria bacterium]|nr:type III-B CRISPR-associated protein Cas10/Cmr2 [Actinomycetota bacterium]